MSSSSTPQRYQRSVALAVAVGVAVPVVVTIIVMPSAGIILEDNDQLPDPDSRPSTATPSFLHVYDHVPPPPPYTLLPVSAAPLPLRHQGSPSTATTLAHQRPLPPSEQQPSGQQRQSTSEQARDDAYLLQGHALSPSKLNRDADGKRKLLLVFIHGFMGDETSFQSFPTHVHNLLSTLLAPTHAVHTKLYPRYRCKGKMDDAARSFSDWLAPHNVHNTDVVLLGHSLGGILAAEVALLTSDSPSRSSPLRHNIIGTISLDAPLLGMHPGIITSGIASLFRRDPPAPPSTSETATTASAQQSSSSVVSSGLRPQPQSPSGPSEQDFSQTYNQPFENDVRLPVRDGWSGAWHFVNKHSDNLTRATQRLLSAHAQFGACLADFDELKARYCRVRLLEEPDEGTRATVLHTSRAPPRVRFTNYYTASTGRIKATKNLEKTAANSIAAAEVVPDGDRSSGGVAQATSVTASSLDSAEQLDELDPLTHVSDDDDESTPSTIDSSACDESDFFLTPTSSNQEGDTTSYVPEPISPSGSTVLHPSLTPPENTSSAISPPPGLALLPVPGIPTLPLLQHFSDRSTYKVALQGYTADIKERQRITTMNRKIEQAFAKHEREVTKLMHKAGARGTSISTCINTTTTTTTTKTYSSASGSDLPVSPNKQALRASHKQERAAAKASAKRDSDTIQAAAKEMSAALKQEAKQAATKDARAALREASKQARENAKLERRRVRADAKTERRAAKTAHKERRRAARDAHRASSTKLQHKPTTAAAAAAALSRDAPFSDEAQKLGNENDAGSSPTGAAQVKEGHFCILPPLDSSKTRDPCWVRVRMDGVDEVGAHCGLFAVQDPGGAAAAGTGTDTGTGWCERYAWLVEDVASRVEDWALDSLALDRR